MWYPRALFDAAGSARLPVFVALVAVLLGPLAAFLAARSGRTPGRPAIVVVQLLSLAGCVLALYVQRPVYLVFTLDRFDLVLSKDIDARDLAKAARPEFQRRPLGPPQFVAVLPPAEQAEVQRILAIALDGGKDLQAYPQHYVPYAQEARNALRRAKAVEGLLGKDPEAVQGYLASAGRTKDSVRFLPLRARKEDGVVLLDAVSGLPLEILLVDPW